jgi:hypothetical protein
LLSDSMLKGPTLFSGKLYVTVCSKLF